MGLVVVLGLDVDDHEKVEFDAFVVVGGGCKTEGLRGLLCGIRYAEVGLAVDELDFAGSAETDIDQVRFAAFLNLFDGEELCEHVFGREEEFLGLGVFDLE